MTVQPGACRYCPHTERDHMQRWTNTDNIGWHKWTPPTQDQIKDRMRARRAAQKRTR